MVGAGAVAIVLDFLVVTGLGQTVPTVPDHTRSTVPNHTVTTTFGFGVPSMLGLTLPTDPDFRVPLTLVGPRLVGVRGSTASGLFDVLGAVGYRTFRGCASSLLAETTGGVGVDRPGRRGVGSCHGGLSPPVVAHRSYRIDSRRPHKPRGQTSQGVRRTNRFIHSDCVIAGMAQHSSDGVLRLVVIVIALVVLLPFLVMALFMPLMWGMGVWGGGMMGGWGGGMMGDWSGGMMAGWGLLSGVMLLGWFLVLLGIGYLFYRGFLRAAPDRTDAALEELRMQYARGELSDEEFEERRSRLAREERID